MTGRREPGRAGSAGGGPMRPWWAAAALVLLAAPASAGSMAGPRITVVADVQATALAAAVAVPGSAWELPGTEGLTLLSASTLLEGIRPALEELGARAAVRCDPAVFTFTLVAPRDAGQAALEVFLDGLFRPAPDTAALERARTRLESALELDASSPAWQARLAIRQALYGDTLSSGWLGPSCGDPATLGRLDLAAVRAGARRFAPAMAHVAVITPGPTAPVRAMLEARVRRDPAPVIPAPRTRTSEFQYVRLPTVTAWNVVAFPFGPDADVDALRLLGAVLADAIAPGVDRPASYTSSWELLRHGAGGALVIQGVSAPDAVYETLERVERVASEAAWSGIPGPVYERVRRRHRGDRLLELAAPEARAVAMAVALAFGRTPAPWPDLDVSQERLRAAARALRPPARAVVGPPVARGDSMP